MSHIRQIILFAGFLVFSYVAVHHFSYPLIWVSAGWTVFSGAAAMLSRRTLSKAIWINLAFCFFLVGALETYAALSLRARHSAAPEGPQLQTTRSLDYMDSHAILGYAPRPNSRADVQLNYGTETIYTISYTFDAHGLRIAPPVEPGGCDRCVLFFGGSFTLGEGVADNETLPFQVGLQSRCPVYNFGFHGYGPHQMLAAIEKGMLADIVACQPQAVIYQAVLDHVSRVAGLSSWGADTPRYQISGDGTLQHSGRFSDIDGLGDHFRAAWRQTQIYHRFVRNRIRADSDDVELLIAVVAASKRKLKALYPGIAFHIILWDNASDKKVKQKLYERLYTGLAGKGFHIHLASQMLSGYLQNRSDYELSPHDNHPNARAYREMAVYITRNVLGEAREGSTGPLSIIGQDYHRD